MNKIKILIADEHALMRKALVFLLRADQQLDIVGDTENTQDLLQLLSLKKTDVIVVSLKTPSLNAQEDLKAINRLHPTVKIIILGINPGQLNRIPNRNFYKHVNKNDDPETLFKAIYSAISPDYYFRRNSIVRVSSVKKTAKENNISEELILNEKEKEILKYICDGKTNKEIASLFQLAPATVDFHRTKIYGKTKSTNVTDLFKYAIRQGLVTV